MFQVEPNPAGSGFTVRDAADPETCATFVGPNAEADAQEYQTFRTKNPRRDDGERHRRDG